VSRRGWCRLKSGLQDGPRSRSPIRTLRRPINIAHQIAASGLVGPQHLPDLQVTWRYLRTSSSSIRPA
jgi:hypothetical protein